MSAFKVVQAGAVAVVLAATFHGDRLQAQSAKPPAPAAASTYSGCLQTAGKDGFVLLTTKGVPEGGKTQNFTYKVIAGSKTLDLAAMANQQVDVKGTLDTKAAGNVPAAVADSARGTGGAGGSGVPGKDNATAFANGTVTAEAITVTNKTCATNPK